MAIAVQIIPPAHVGVHAKNSAAQATAAFENDIARRRDDSSRDKDEFGGVRGGAPHRSWQQMELNVGKQIGEMHI
jgi:hypothetical protein